MINIVNVARAYSEVYEFLNVLGEEYKKKIPDRILNNIESNRDKSFRPRYDIDMEINSTTFSKEALSLIAALNLQYWCEDSEEKRQLKNAYIENTNKEHEKYSYDNLFKDRKKYNEVENVKEEIALVETKTKSFIKRFFEKIMDLFSKK